MKVFGNLKIACGSLSWTWILLLMVLFFGYAAVARRNKWATKAFCNDYISFEIISHFSPGTSIGVMMALKPG